MSSVLLYIISDGESNFSEINQQGLIYAFSASDEQALPLKIFRGKMALLSQKYVNIRPIAFESSFVVNRRIFFGHQARIFHFSMFHIKVSVL